MKELLKRGVGQVGLTFNNLQHVMVRHTRVLFHRSHVPHLHVCQGGVKASNLHSFCSYVIAVVKFSE